MSDIISAPFNQEVVLKWFRRYPQFETFVGAGVISLKLAREILDVDRYFMYDIYCELIQAGAIVPAGTNGFRATKSMQEFLRERRAQARSIE